MKPSIIPPAIEVTEAEKPNWVDAWAARLVKAQLAQLRQGEIVIREGGREEYFGNMSDDFPLRVHIDVRHPSVWSDVAFGGSAGSGEAYIKGSWQCKDLVGLVRILLRNRDVLDDMDGHWSRLKLPLHKLAHWLSRNTKSGSKKNIAAHYDLGNDFFRLFLDPTMMYSSAYYTEQADSLDKAAVEKLDLICRKLDLKAGDSVLEIGTGWGGFAVHAAKHYGCHVTTTTISEEQYKLAQQRVEEAELQGRVTLLLEDYRDLEGQYDKMVSIEMIEAIGHQYLDTYFRTCCDRLKPGGQMLLQAITIVDQRYKVALSKVDFIKKYIFPGGFLPSVTAMSQSMTHVSELRIVNLEDIGQHYARTLSDWRCRFFNHIEHVKAQGYSESFIRMWEYYLCYCEGGFLEQDIGTVQMVLTKPNKV